jgi:ABC-type sulfate transport system permease component
MQQIASTDLEQRRTVPFRSTSRGVVFWLLAACMMLYLVGPLVYFLFVLPWSAVWSTLSDPDAVQALITSAMSATIATAFMTLFGVPLGYVLARFAFPGKSIVSVAIYLPLVFPPVISGIILLILFGPYGLIGGPLTNAGWEIDDTLAGIVLAQIFVAAPFVIVAARSAFESIDPRLEQVAATLGHHRWSLFWRVSLPLARGGVIAGLILAWMRALGEFGATVVLAYHPYTIPVFTFVQLSSVGVAGALPLALFSLGLSIIVIGAIVIVQRRLGRSNVL